MKLLLKINFSDIFYCNIYDQRIIIYRLDETISRLSDIGMHPHIYQNSHAEHKKVKRAASFQISDDEFTNKYWMESAKKSVESKVKQAFNNKRAKNVIFFLGDGLSHTSIGK